MNMSSNNENDKYLTEEAPSKRNSRLHPDTTYGSTFGVHRSGDVLGFHKSVDITQSIMIVCGEREPQGYPVSHYSIRYYPKLKPLVIPQYRLHSPNFRMVDTFYSTEVDAYVRELSEDDFSKVIEACRFGIVELGNGMLPTTLERVYPSGISRGRLREK